MATKPRVKNIFKKYMLISTVQACYTANLNLIGPVVTEICNVYIFRKTNMAAMSRD